MGGVLASRRRDTGAISISDLSTLKPRSVDDGEPIRRRTTPLNIDRLALLVDDSMHSHPKRVESKP